MGDQVSSISGQIDGLRGELVQQRKVGKGLQHAVDALSKKYDKSASDSIVRDKKWEETVHHERQQNQNKIAEVGKKVGEVNRRISDVSIEIMKSIQKAEE